MPNIFDVFDAVPTDDVGFVADPPQQQPPNIFDAFDSVPATSNVPGGAPINSDNNQAARAQFLATILHPPVLNPGLGVHQPSMFSSGFFPGAGEPISLQNADDWGFLAAVVPKILNNAVTRTVGTGLNAAGQAIKGGVESDLFKATGQPDLATQEKIATIAKIFPQLGLKASAHGVDVSDPYEDARQTLPAPERIASGIGPGLLQSAPQMALTAVQPELGAVSFGFTPDGFDPVQAATMMVAPDGGKIVGGVAKDLAVKAGISDAQALDVINRLGGGAGVASLISAPTAYQIARMNPGPDRNEAIPDAVLNAIIAGIFGGLGEHSAPEKPAMTTADTAQNAVPEPTVAEDLPVQTGPAKQQQQKPVSEKLDLLTAMLNDVQDMLRGRPSVPGQHAVEEPTDPVDQIIRNLFPAEEGPAEAIGETFPDGTVQPARDSTVPPKLVVPEITQAKNVPGSATAVPVAPEPHYVYSPDGIGGIDQQVAQAGVKNYLRRQNNVPPVQIVNDPSWTHNGYGVRGTVQDGQIIVNTAFIDSADTLQKVLREEHNHSLLSSEAGRQIIRYGFNLSDAQLTGLATKYPIQSGESAPDYRARLYDEFIAKAASEKLPVWQQIVERVKAWLADKGIGQLSDEETARAIVRALKSDKAAAESAFALTPRRPTPFDTSDSAIEERSEEDSDFAARYNLTDEPIEGISKEQATEAINQFFGTKDLPRQILVARNQLLPWKTMPLRNGSIAVNSAKMSTQEETPLAILHTGLREILPWPKAQSAWRYIHSNLTPNDLKSAYNRRIAQGLPTHFPAVHEEAAIARLINSDRRDRIVENFHNTIRALIGQRMGAYILPRAHPQVKGATIQFLRERTQGNRIAGIPAADPAKARPLRNVLMFNGIEVRAVRNLSHLKEGTLRMMARYGFAGTTKTRKPIVHHHLAQNPAGPLVEMPKTNNKISNVIQHPFGNTPGSGLTKGERGAHNAWRNVYWRWRAKQELAVRRQLGQ